MKIDLRHYNNIAPTVGSVCKNNAGKEVAELVSLIAVASNAPAVVSAYYYAAYIGGINDDVQKQIDVLVKFYGYEEIIGIEDILGKNDGSEQEMPDM